MIRPLLLALLLAPAALAQRHALPAPPSAVRASAASEAWDATYYHVAVDLDMAAERIAGTTRAEGTLTAPLAELRLDLLANLTVGAVRDADGAPLAFSRAGDVLVVDLGATRPAGSRVIVEVDYAGQPQASGFGAFAFSSRDGPPVAWTLSEPYGARAWWPGKDHPSDKADSVRVSVTLPAGLRVGSNGMIESETTAGGRTTVTWVSRYPIAPYLVSLAAGPYAAFTQTYVRPDSLAAGMGALAMPVLHYRYTEGGTASLPDGWAEVLDALAVFEWWFGPYPFAAEKYGHAQFGWAGGMEHQTMSSMGGTGTGLVAHELAHQWFGDSVTLRTWPHLWLNEGFASYSEVLYFEAFESRHPGQALATLRGDQSNALSAVGTLVVQDTTRVNNLFAGNRVYAKGSAVLHMLRRAIGDDAFRRTLRAYAAETAYGTALTDDLRAVAERESGRSLEAFFRQWVTDGTGYPSYALVWSHTPAAGGHDVSVTIRQTQTVGQSNMSVFEMPVVLAVETAAGERRFTVENTARDQTVVLTVDALPLGVAFDPDRDLLRSVTVPVDSGDAATRPPFTFALTPNPAAGRVRLDGSLNTATDAFRVTVVDAVGRTVRVLRDGPIGAGAVRLDAALDGLAPGLYTVVARAGDAQWAGRLSVVR